MQKGITTQTMQPDALLGAFNASPRSLEGIWSETGRRTPFLAHRTGDHAGVDVAVMFLSDGDAYGFPVSEGRRCDAFWYTATGFKPQAVPQGGAKMWTLRSLPLDSEADVLAEWAARTGVNPPAAAGAQPRTPLFDSEGNFNEALAPAGGDKDRAFERMRRSGAAAGPAIPRGAIAGLGAIDDEDLPEGEDDVRLLPETAAPAGPAPRIPQPVIPPAAPAPGPPVRPRTPSVQAIPGLGTDTAPAPRKAAPAAERPAAETEQRLDYSHQRCVLSREERNAFRARLQDEALGALMTGGRLILNWGTGVGKSRVAILAADRLWSDGQKRILLLVAEDAHKQNWRNEFEQTLGAEKAAAVLGDVTMECYASLGKYASTAWDLVVADEAHHLRSELRRRTLATLVAGKVLCLSATLSDKGDADALVACLQATFGVFESRTYTLQNAIDDGLLPPPDIRVHVIGLDDIKETMQVTVDRGFLKKAVEGACDYADFRTRWKNGPANYRLTVSCTAREGYGLLCEFYKAAEADKDEAEARMNGAVTSDGRETAARRYEFAKNRWLQYGNRRKSFMGACKLAFSEQLLGALGDRKYLCFCSDVEQSRALGGEHIINSGRTPKANADTIRAFNDGEFRRLFAVGMLTEGVSIRGIEAGVIIQMGGKDRKFIQQVGRTVRADYPEQHIVVLNETRDVHYLDECLGGFDRKLIRYYRHDLDGNRLSAESMRT